MKEKPSIVIYKGKIEVKLEEDTLWLTQAQIVELFETSKANVSEHIKRIFADEELYENSVVRNFRTTAADGKSYNVNYWVSLKTMPDPCHSRENGNPFLLLSSDEKQLGSLPDYKFRGKAANEKHL